MEKVMTQFSCTYGDGRDEAIVAFLYDEPDAAPAERSGGFDAHLQICARCQADVAALRGVRTQLSHWSPPEPVFALYRSSASADASGSIALPQQAWWRAIPAWAQVAAALLFLGVSAGLANLDIQYNQNGLTVRTGWLQSSTRTAAGVSPEASGTTAVAQRVDSAADAPWRAELAALERQMKSEIRAAQASTTAAGPSARPVLASASEADVARRVRALVDESEKRQQRELALRLAELARDVTAQRQADMVKIDRTLGLVQNNVGIEVMKTREKMNQMDLIYRASQRQ
jgi:hypothetical protein